MLAIAIRVWRISSERKIAKQETIQVYIFAVTFIIGRYYEYCVRNK